MEGWSQHYNIMRNIFCRMVDLFRVQGSIVLVLKSFSLKTIRLYNNTYIHVMRSKVGSLSVPSPVERIAGKFSHQCCSGV